MNPTHPKSRLVPYVLGELRGPRRTRLEEHLSGCAECSREVDEFRRILADLRASEPAAPSIPWPRYREEIEERLAGRRARWPGWASLLRPIPVALSAGLVAAGVLLFVIQGGVQRGTSQAEFSIAEELLLYQRLEILRHYSLLERLDLLEDLEAIRNLDNPESREG